MKNLLLSTIFTFSVLALSAQNILVADNNPGAPSGAHVYSTLQAAVNAASAGDIIHVIPSATIYDNGSTTVTIAKDSISIYGVGFKPDKDGPQIAKVYQLYVNGSGIRISGLEITYRIALGQTGGPYNGITVENCDVGFIYNTAVLSNILIRGCLVNRNNDTSGPGIDFNTNVNNSVVTNCIIESYTGSDTYEMIGAYNGTIIKNNILFGQGSTTAFENLQNCTVSNNIFFGALPIATTSLSNCVFNNNIAVDNVGGNYTLPPSGQTGFGNYTGTDTTIFESTSVQIQANWSLTWDPEVAGDSLIGTDNTEIGILGGTIPFSRTGTTLPLIQKLIIQEVIKQGDDINATIKATGN